MKVAIAVLLASVNAIQLRADWPSVARCNPGQISSNSSPCDNNNKGPNSLDGTAVQLEAKWPSVARCNPG